MLLSTPETIQNILWQGQLELDSEEIEEENFRFISRPSQPSYAAIVSIGQPEVWQLAELYYPCQDGLQAISYGFVRHFGKLLLLLILSLKDNF